MASRNVKLTSVQGFDTPNINEKMQSSTLKRQPSPDWSKSDLLRLLSYFEGELQARDITIATLKAEKAKQLLYQAKYGRFGLGDPFIALQRDAEGKNDTGFDEAAIKSMYDNQLAQLENLIATQRKAQLKMREQLGNSEKRFHKVCTELEEEKQKHAQDTAQGDDVTYMLEKERERLKAEIDFEKSQNKKLEKDLKKTLASLEEERANAARHKQVAIMLIKERKNLIERIVAENHLRDEMESALTDGKSKIQSMAEGLAQESKKSLKMEVALDKQSSKFDSEREALRIRLQEEEKQTNILRTEVACLSKQLESLQIQVRNSTSSPNASQIRSSVSPARSTNPTARGTAMAGVISTSVGPASQSVSSNHTPPQGYSPQPSMAAAAGGIRPGAGHYPAHGMTNKMYTAPQGGAKVSEGVRMNSISPEKDIYKPENVSPGVNIVRRGPGPSGMRMGQATVTGVERLEVDVGSGARVVNISPGSAATVTTHGGGKISFHVAGSGSQSSVQAPMRKTAAYSPNTSPVGRGIPPPIPPNKPNFVSTVTTSAKPSPPPKVSVVGSGVLIQSPGQDQHQGHFSNPSGKTLAQQPQRAIQIPVTVVGGPSSPGAGQPPTPGSIASVRTQVRDTSPSAVRKTSQPLVVSTAPLEHHFSSAASLAAPHGSSQLEFLGPEMANLQNVLATMTGETSACTTHVSPPTNVNSLSSICSSHTQSVTSVKYSPNYNINPYSEGNCVKTIHSSSTTVMTAQLENSYKTMPENGLNKSSSVDLDIAAHYNIPHHVQNDCLDNKVVQSSSPVITSSPMLYSTGGIQSQPFTSLKNAPKSKIGPARSRSRSPTKSHSRSSFPKLYFTQTHASNQSAFTPTSQSAEDHQVHQLSALGDVMALEKLLKTSPSAVNLMLKDSTTPLHRAAEHDQDSCLQLLLDYGALPDCFRDDQMTPLHIAASKGYSRCVELLLSSGAQVNLFSNKKQTPIHLATKGGHAECCQILLKFDAEVMLTDQDGLTCVHNAVQHNQPHILKSLLDKLGLLSEPKDSDVGYQLVSITDRDGWSIAHMAAYLPKPECLIILAESLALNLEVKDKLGRSVAVVASPSCKEILAEIDRFVKPMMKVNVELRYVLEKKVVSNVQVGLLDIGPSMGWRYLEDRLRTTLNDYLASLDAGLKTRRISRLDSDIDKEFSLGVLVNNITQYELGFYKWIPGMQTDTLPYAMLSNNQHRKITVVIDDIGNMSELIAFDVIQPVATINNYLRLLEQNKTVIFYGPAGSGKSYLAQRLAQSIAAQEISKGNKPGIFQLSLDTGYSWLEFVTFLKDRNCVVPLERVVENIAPIVVVDNLEKVDMAEIFAELLDAMEYRGMKHSFVLRDGQGESRMHYLSDNFYLIGTMNKSRSLGVDLSILPRFRWVQFRLDTEPLRGLLSRHFLRRILNIYNGQLPPPDDPVLRAVEWIICVWYRLNDSLNKLGLMEVVIGPCMFFKCPVEKKDHSKILEWMKNFWNKKIAPCVRETVKRGTGSEAPSDGHNKVANTALYVLMQRSIMLSCPLSGTEKDNYLSAFSGSNELDIPLKGSDRSKHSPSLTAHNHLKAGVGTASAARRWRSETEETNAGTSSPSRMRGRTSKEEKLSSESNHTSNIKRRSLSESSVNKTILLEQQQQEQYFPEGLLSPSSSQAKVAKLEVKSPKLVSIQSQVFFNPTTTLVQKPESNSNLNVPKTGRVSPLLSLVVGRQASPQKSRSTENISSYTKVKSPGPFSFSLTAPKSNFGLFKFLNYDEEKLSKRLSEEMPDFSVFERVTTPTKELTKGFSFSKADEINSALKREKAEMLTRRLDTFGAMSDMDSSTISHG